MSIIVYPYKKGLNSTRLLRQEGARIRYGTSTLGRGGVAIAWGMRTPPPWVDRVKWINPPSALVNCTNKLRWSEAFDGDPYHPEWTTDKEEAQAWTEERGEKVVCREYLTSSQGKGITIARNPSQVTDAKLYTKYFKKNREYRVLIGISSGIVHTSSKRAPQGTEMDRDQRLVRTKGNGYVFQIEAVTPLQVTKSVEQALAYASDRWGINLLGFDVAYNSETDQAMIIEANTAFGLNEVSAPKVYDAMLQIGAEL